MRHRATEIGELISDSQRKSILVRVLLFVRECHLTEADIKQGLETLTRLTNGTPAVAARSRGGPMASSLPAPSHVASNTAISLPLSQAGTFAGDASTCTYLVVVLVPAGASILVFVDLYLGCMPDRLDIVRISLGFIIAGEKNIWSKSPPENCLT